LTFGEPFEGVRLGMLLGFMKHFINIVAAYNFLHSLTSKVTRKAIPLHSIAANEVVGSLFI
jgi:hypothetical protein